jgi:hypothetical protein
MRVYPSKNVWLNIGGIFQLEELGLTYNAESFQR